MDDVLADLSLNHTPESQDGLLDDEALPAGVVGKYAYFSGEQDSESYEYIRVSDDSVLEALQGEGTISAWLFRDVDEHDNDWRNVYDIPDSHLLEFSPSGGFDWRAENGHQDFFNVNGPKIGIDDWFHVAVTMSEDDDGGYVPSVYVNGDLTDESTNWQIGEQGNDNGLKTTADDLYLGILWSQNGEDGKRNNPDPWKGGIDEFKVWKSSLSAVEIDGVYKGQNDIRQDDLLIHFDFEKISPGQIVDSSGHNVIGIVEGNVSFKGDPVEVGSQSLGLDIVSAKNGVPGDSYSGSGILSPNGNYSAFYSTAKNLLPSEINLEGSYHIGGQLYVKNIETDELTHVTGKDGWIGDGDIDVARPLALDDQGNLLFASDQKWDESDDSYSDQSDVYLWNNQQETHRLLTTSLGFSINARDASFTDTGSVIIEAYAWDFDGDNDHEVLLEVNPHGQDIDVIASEKAGWGLDFVGQAEGGDLVRKKGESGLELFYLEDTEFFQTDVLKSINAIAFEGNTVGTDVSLTSNGKSISFISNSELLPGYQKTDRHAYLASLESGLIEILDTNEEGIPVKYSGDMPEDADLVAYDYGSGSHDGTAWLATSEDGKYASFATWNRTSELAGNDWSKDAKSIEIFVKDLKSGELQRVDNASPDRGGIDLGISADGSRIIFSTYASQLEADQNDTKDVYIASNPFFTPNPEINISRDKLLNLEASVVDRLEGVGVNQISVLGERHDSSGDYRIDITAESLSKVHNLEAVEVTIQLDPKLFESINLSDVQISSQLPIQNAIQIDNEAGTVTLSGASLANLGQGTMINGDQALASINLNFDNDYLETIAYNDVTGELELSPVSFQMSVAEEKAIFSRDFTDSTGQLNRDIQSLAELNGDVALNSDRVSLIKEIVRMEEESGLTLGTQRTIGVKGEFTNLVREGATLEATTEWRNTGNTTVDGLQVEAINNENARLVDAQFSQGKQSLESGRFVDGEWLAEAAESTEITAKVEVTGQAGNVLDLSEGILGVSTETSEEVFENEEGSKNLITYQGDLNYDGRVSFKDLAYLNAGAARQELVDKLDEDGNQLTNDFGAVEQVASEASYASDVDANYDGKVSIADLSVLEKDWGKSLHTGDESFLGSGEALTWESIDGDGTWDNSSFKRENAAAAEQIAEAQEAAAAVTEAVDEGAGGGLSDSPVEVQQDDGLLGSEVY